MTDFLLGITVAWAIASPVMLALCLLLVARCARSTRPARRSERSYEPPEDVSRRQREIEGRHLLPCGYCGSENLLPADHSLLRGAAFHVLCLDCHAQVEGDDQPDADREWNAWAHRETARRVVEDDGWTMRHGHDGEIAWSKGLA